MLEMLLIAYIIGVAVAVPLGPVIIAGGRRAVVFGFGPAFFFMMGAVSADTIYIILVYIGLAPLLEKSDPLRLAMWGIGGAWLCWLGIEAIRTRVTAEEMTGAVERESRWRSYTSGLGLTLFSPLTLVAWIVLAGNFFAGWQEDWGSQDDLGLLALLAMLGGVLTWALGLMLILSLIRRFIRPALLYYASVAAGIVLILFGLRAWLAAAQMIL